MRSHIMRTLLASLIAISFCLSNAARADDDAPQPPEKNWSDDLKASAEKVLVFADAEADEPLLMKVAYKWYNPARANDVLGQRLFLLYVDEGRPVASCKIYPTGRAIVHTPISFTDLPLVARQNAAVIWRPPPSAPRFATLENVDAPQTSAGARRIQMKSLAREFSMETGSGEAKRQSASPELRLLAQPLYRYQVKDEGQDGVVDGAAFCFVANGGNPQALLLLEAVRKGETLSWRFGFTRRTFAQLKAFREKKQVWFVKYLPPERRTSTDTFFKLILPVNEDPATASAE